MSDHLVRPPGVSKPVWRALNVRIWALTQGGELSQPVRWLMLKAVEGRDDASAIAVIEAAQAENLLAPAFRREAP